MIFTPVPRNTFSISNEAAMVPVKNADLTNGFDIIVSLVVINTVTIVNLLKS